MTTAADFLCRTQSASHGHCWGQDSRGQTQPCSPATSSPTCCPSWRLRAGTLGVSPGCLQGLGTHVRGQDLCLQHRAWHQDLFLAVLRAPSPIPSPPNRRDALRAQAERCPHVPAPRKGKTPGSFPSPQGQLQASPFLLQELPHLWVSPGSALPPRGGVGRAPWGSVVFCSTARATGHRPLCRESSFQLHANGSWKEKVSVVFPLRLPGGDNLGFLERKVVLGHSSACRQIKAMEVALQPAPGAR